MTTPHEWADVLERAADEVRTGLREGVCDGCDHPTCKRDREEADTISAALRTLATAFQAAKPVAKSLRTKGKLLLLLTLPESS